MAGMASLRLALPVVAGALLASLALSGCSADASSTPAPTSSSARSADAAVDAPAASPAVDPMEEDRSAAAVCGQISALSTIALNASDGRSRGALTDAQYEALIAAERFGYEHLSSSDERLDNAIDYAHEYLDAHPAPTSGPALEDSAEWDLVGRTLNTACQQAGSNVVATAQSGG
ncbi:hypothetical protein EDF42_0140 [Curtobacterium sp. PhB172]|nr:hypothetical protein EDF42_0140 [Curtobacterium sp. PhB172]